MAQCNTRGIWNEGGFGTRPYRFPLLIFYKQITPKSVITRRHDVLLMRKKED